MAGVVQQFIEATSLNDNLMLDVDAAGLPEFDTSLHSREAVAAELGPLIGRALRIQAEFMGSMPTLNAARDRHVSKAEASLTRAGHEHAASLEHTLRPSPRGAALLQVTNNELTASLQLRGTATSIIEDLATTFGAMNERLGVLDIEAALIPPDTDIVTWSMLARGAINSYLIDKE